MLHSRPRWIDLKQTIERAVLRDLLQPIRADEQHPSLTRLPEEKVEERQRSLIRPVEIVEQEEERPLSGETVQRLYHPAEESQPPAFRIAASRLLQIRQAGPELRDDASDLGQETLQLGSKYHLR